MSNIVKRILKSSSRSAATSVAPATSRTVPSAHQPRRVTIAGASVSRRDAVYAMSRAFSTRVGSADQSADLPAPYNEARLEMARVVASRMPGTNSSLSMARYLYFTHLDLSGTAGLNRMMADEQREMPDFMERKAAQIDLRGNLVKLKKDPATGREKIVKAEFRDLKSVDKIFFAGKDTGEGASLASLMRIFRDELHKGSSGGLLGFHHDELNAYVRDSWACDLYNDPSFATAEMKDFVTNVFMPLVFNPEKPLNIETFSAGGRSVEMLLNAALPGMKSILGEDGVQKYLTGGRMFNLATATDYSGHRRLGTTLAVVGVTDQATKPTGHFAEQIFCNQKYQREPYTLVKIGEAEKDYLIVLGSDAISPVVGKTPNIFSHHPKGYVEAMRAVLPPELMQLCQAFNTLSEKELSDSMRGAFEKAEIYSPMVNMNYGHALTAGRDALLKARANQLALEDKARQELVNSKKGPSKTDTSKSHVERVVSSGESSRANGLQMVTV